MDNLIINNLVMNNSINNNSIMNNDNIVINAIDINEIIADTITISNTNPNSMEFLENEYIEEKSEIESNLENNLENNVKKEKTERKKVTRQLTSIEIYMNHLYKKCEIGMSPIAKNSKKADEYTPIPTFSEYEMLNIMKYNTLKLKFIAKKYKIKMSGNKNELQIRIYNYLKLSNDIVKIQKIFRGHLQRIYNFYHGPAFFKRELCTNNTDFMTIDDIKDISFSQFISFKDKDNFIYGFDIVSLYNLILKSGKSVKNPYNRSEIPAFVMLNLKHILRIGKMLHIQIDTQIKDIIEDVTPQKATELRILELFQTIDSLGNYSDPFWFASLDRSKLLRFLREMMDIWEYRAQLSMQVKRCICPPYGDPFRNVGVLLNREQNIDNIRKMILGVMEKLVYSGMDKDNQSLGAYYVLGALTLVNEDAALSLPWLYQSLNYFSSNTLS